MLMHAIQLKQLILTISFDSSKINIHANSTLSIHFHKAEVFAIKN